MTNNHLSNSSYLKYLLLVLFFLFFELHGRIVFAQQPSDVPNLDDLRQLAAATALEATSGRVCYDRRYWTGTSMWDDKVLINCSALDILSPVIMFSDISNLMI